MHLVLVLLLIASAAFLAVAVVATVDLALYLRVRAREAREFAHRRHVRLWHLVPSSTMGDPASCQSPDHNHAPEDFGLRFRSRSGAIARIGAIVLLLSIVVVALLSALIAWLVAIV